MESQSTVPANANTDCPGTEAEEAGKAAACAGCPNQVRETQLKAQSNP